MRNVTSFLFMKRGMIGIIIVLICIDDIVITGDDFAEISRLENILAPFLLRIWEF